MLWGVGARNGSSDGVGDVGVNTMLMYHEE